MARLLLAVVAVVILGARILGQAQQPAMATAALPAFDAASIKPPDPKGIGATNHEHRTQSPAPRTKNRT